MTQLPMDFDVRPSFLDRLEQFFTSRTGEWIDGRQLGTIAGSYAWRTRVSDLRTKRGLTIENRQRHVELSTGQTITVSEYRLVRETDPALAKDIGC